MQIELSLRQFVIDNFLFGQDQGFSNDTSFVESGIVNSTGMLEVIAHIEESYNIRIEDSEFLLENFDSVSRLTRFVKSKLEVPTGGIA